MVAQVEFPTSVTIRDLEYGIDVEFVRKKNSSVVVRDQKLYFRISSRLSKKEAQTHFDELLAKISKTLIRSPQPKRSSGFEEAFEKGSFVLANEQFTFNYHKFKYVRVMDSNVIVIPQGFSSQELERPVIKVLCDHFQARFDELVAAINSQTYNFEYTSVTLNVTKSKWGHCTHRNELMFHLALYNAPFEVLRYVIIHELAHIKVKNHSQRFWDLVARHCPNYKQLRKYLKDNTPRIFHEQEAF